MICGLWYMVDGRWNSGAKFEIKIQQFKYFVGIQFVCQTFADFHLP